MSNEMSLKDLIKTEKQKDTKKSPRTIYISDEIYNEVNDLISKKGLNFSNFVVKLLVLFLNDKIKINPSDWTL